ncbi:M23 family metallopeptidase [Nannocystis exedens]|uniref:M23 family metallopeptidase n=1 Tax=Nannocystis exedens TaxID=54 RepID=UPI000BBA03B4|nr:M23 family metallopeptidase [Nannocystis exedens]PCC66466.1 Peptidase family M23 [Nannocystis exedens]
MPLWPLPTPRQEEFNASTRFEAKRPWGSAPQQRYHCGVDLRASKNTPILAPEDLIIVDVDRGWQGPAKATLVHTISGKSIIAGCTALGSSPKVGTLVKAGQEFARVGQYAGGSSMLHFQLYDTKISSSQANNAQSWRVNTPRPAHLLDPMPYLMSLGTEPQPTPKPGQGEGGRDYARPCQMLDGQLVCVLPDVEAWAETLRQRAAQATAAEAAFRQRVEARKAKETPQTIAASEQLALLVRAPLEDHDQGVNDEVPPNERVGILVEACKTAVKVTQVFNGRRGGGGGGGLLLGALLLAGGGGAAYYLSKRNKSSDGKARR